MNKEIKHCVCGKSYGLYCNHADGCSYGEKKPVNKIEQTVMDIAAEMDKPVNEKGSKVLEAGNFLSGTGVVIKTPNGDEFRFRYDKDAGAIIVNKMSDSMRTGAISVTIQPGGGTNQIFIK